jgi:hypothetical protein
MTVSVWCKPMMQTGENNTVCWYSILPWLFTLMAVNSSGIQVSITVSLLQIWDCLQLMKHNTPLLWLPMKASVCFVCTCVRVYTRACASVFGYVSLLKCAYFSGATFMCRLMCLSVSHTIWLLGNHCFPIQGPSIRAGMKSKGTQQSKWTSVLFLWTTNNVKMFWSICPTTSVWEQKTEIQTLTASHLG